MNTQEESVMATPDAVLDKLSASNIFDLTGVVAVVTGGGTVSVLAKCILYP